MTLASMPRFEECADAAAHMVLQEQDIFLYEGPTVDRFWLEPGRTWHRVCQATQAWLWKIEHNYRVMKVRSK